MALIPTGDEPTQAQLTAAQLLGRTVALFSDKVEQVTTERTADEVAMVLLIGLVLFVLFML